jgi:L,D-peptidoglycan transpeptidase YkuD (ErfK/YbiS/YcfS/YnhG family)
MSEGVVCADGRFTFQGRILRAALGRGGVSQHKQEGDGATPAGQLVLRRLLYRADRMAIPRSSLPRAPLAPDDGWCDDPADADYNRQVRLPHDARHEELWRQDGVYDLIGVLGWNDAPVARGAGSAIFLHVARADFAPTDGCIALPLADVLGLLAAGLSAIRVTA